MNAGRRGLALLAVAGFIACVSMSGLALGVQKGKDDKKRDEAELKEIEALVTTVDNVATGQPAPTGISVTWEQHHFIKGQSGKTYVPYTISIDPASLGSQSLGLYIRIASRTAPTMAASADGNKKDNKKKDSRPDYAFEDVHFLELKPPPAGQRQMVSRAFFVAPGEYDLYIAAKERTPADKGKSGATAGKVGVLKQSLTVPDFASGELTTSTPIFATQAEQVGTPIGIDRQLDNPYTIGATRIVPSLDGKFSKGGELNAILFLYNQQLDEAKKPNVTVEFNFHQKTAEGEKFFNKTAPQDYNAQTLPPQFDAAVGILPVVTAVPLKTFPEGQYRLEIKITDNLAKKTIIREVVFTVVAA